MRGNIRFIAGTAVLAFLLVPAARAKLLMELTFEDGKRPQLKDHPHLHKKGGYECGGTGCQVVSENARSGKYSMRFQCGKGNKRSEMKTTYDPPLCERWFGYSQFIPQNWAKGGWGYYSQWHSYPDFDKGECWGRGPTIKMVLADDFVWTCATACSPRPVDGCKDKAPIRSSKKIGPMDRGVWADWVFHIIYDYHEQNNKGLIEIWKRKKGEAWGEILYRYQGPVGFNDKVGSYWKWGTYEPGSKGHTRVMFYDEIRVGDENSSFEEVAPGRDGTKPVGLLFTPAVTRHAYVPDAPRAIVSEDMKVFFHGIRNSLYPVDAVGRALPMVGGQVLK